MKRWVVLGGALLALLVSGCDALSGIAGEFQPTPEVEVVGPSEGVCVRLEAIKETRTVGSWTSCTTPYTFRVSLPNGAYTLVGRAERDGLVYQEGRAEATLERGRRTLVGLSRKRVNVQVTAAWVDPGQGGLAEAWMLPQEAVGVPTYADTPPDSLNGRVLVAREVVAQGRATLSTPTGKDVAFRLVQGETEGVVRVSRLEADGRVVVP